MVPRQRLDVRSGKPAPGVNETGQRLDLGTSLGQVGTKPAEPNKVDRSTTYYN